MRRLWNLLFLAARDNRRRYIRVNPDHTCVVQKDDCDDSVQWKPKAALRAVWNQPFRPAIVQYRCEPCGTCKRHNWNVTLWQNNSVNETVEVEFH